MGQKLYWLYAINITCKVQCASFKRKERDLSNALTVALWLEHFAECKLKPCCEEWLNYFLLSLAIELKSGKTSPSPTMVFLFPLPKIWWLSQRHVWTWAAAWVHLNLLTQKSLNVLNLKESHKECIKYLATVFSIISQVGSNIWSSL